LQQVAAAVEQVRHMVLGTDRMIDLHAELGSGFGRTPAAGDVVIADIADGARHEPGPVRHQHGLRQRDVLIGYGAELLDGNHVSGEGIANRPGPGGIGPRRTGIVNRDQLVLAIHQIGEVALVHLRSGNGGDHAGAALAVAEAFVSRKEESAVLAVIDLGNPHRPAANRRNRSAGRRLWWAQRNRANPHSRCGRSRRPTRATHWFPISTRS
jgi:hypothetical protein